MANLPTNVPDAASFGLTTAQENIGGGAPPSSPPGLDHVVALFTQFISAASPQQQVAPITDALSQITTIQEQFLAHPHHS